MKTLSCKALGNANCNFVAEGKTIDDVKNAMFQHAAESHSDILAKMSEEDRAKVIELMDSLLGE